MSSHSFREHFQTFYVTVTSVDGSFFVLSMFTRSLGVVLSPCYEETVAGGIETEARPYGLQTPSAAGPARFARYRGRGSSSSARCAFQVAFRSVFVWTCSGAYKFAAAFGNVPISH